MNRLTRHLFIIVLFALLAGCGTSTQVKKMESTAENAYQAGDYPAALAAYQPVIANYENAGKSSQCPVYTHAGISALKCGDTEKAAEYLEKATWSEFDNPDAGFYLAAVYREIDNLSKELMTLEGFIDKYPLDEKVKQARERLFDVYAESENTEKALQLWPVLDEGFRNQPEHFEAWFVLNCLSTDSGNCDALAEQLLALDPANKTILEWKGEQYFWKAENRYQAEMKAYERKKTSKQYKILLKALDSINADFRVALGYYQQLYKIDPKPAYARYLSNIYKRFDDKKKAEYYDEKAGN